MQTSVFSDTKNHFEILDGLRGVAAITIVVFHVFETFNGGNHQSQIINHGYLAVDFFFLLSGFVIGYAYDDRWNKMSLKDFFKRRLIRLHPMIVMGMTIGAIAFYFSASPNVFPHINEVPVGKLILVMLIGYTLLPVPTSMDIRGWQEMHPLDGPAWSLFFEYVANILYALFIRRFSNTLLAVFVFISGVALIHFSVTTLHTIYYDGVQCLGGDVIGGWSLTPEQLRIGITRLLYPFFAGLLLSRIYKPMRINHAFIWCSLLTLVFLSIPRLGDNNSLWMNGLYDSLTIVFVFPFIVFLGASGEVKGKIMNKICKFFGDISYPIYIIHYPLIYIYTAWVVDNKPSVSQAWLGGTVLFAASVTIAYASLKLYDIPVRKWLTHRFLSKSK